MPLADRSAPRVPDHTDTLEDERKPDGDFASGRPAANSPRRCQALLLKRHGRQCRRWALKGSKFCPFHGGRKKKLLHNVDRKMPGIYSKKLGPTLAKALEEAVSQPNGEMLRVYEELALVRLSSQESVRLFSAVYELPDDHPKKSESLLMTGSLMRESLQEVIKVAQTAASIESQQNDRVSIQHLAAVVEQIVRLAYEAFGEDHLDLVQNYESLIRGKVRLPKPGSDGTTITPDQDVMEMDDTVPRYEEPADVTE